MHFSEGLVQLERFIKSGTDLLYLMSLVVSTNIYLVVLHIIDAPNLSYLQD